MAFSSVLDLLFPTICLECGTFTQDAKTLCAACLSAIPLHRTLFCAACRMQLPGGIYRCHPGAPYILGCATDYRWSMVASLIKNLKFSFQKHAADALAQLLILYIKNLSLEFLEEPLVIPMPLSTSRLRHRDFNQAEEIARCFAEYFGFHLLPRALRRTRDTLPQSSLKLSERHLNVKDCFAPNPRAVAGRDVILIDDVTTSGATLFEAAAALQKSGVKTILALTVAKA